MSGHPIQRRPEVTYGGVGRNLMGNYAKSPLPTLLNLERRYVINIGNYAVIHVFTLTARKVFPRVFFCVPGIAQNNSLKKVMDSAGLYMFGPIRGIDGACTMAQLSGCPAIRPIALPEQLMEPPGMCQQLMAASRNRGVWAGLQRGPDCTTRCQPCGDAS